MLVVHIARRNRCKRLLSLLVGSMSSSVQSLKRSNIHLITQSPAHVSPIPWLMKVFSENKSFFYPNVGSHAIQRGAETALEDSSGLTLIRLQSVKDQWVGHISDRRTNRRCVPTGSQTNNREGCPGNSRVKRNGYDL